MRISRKALAFLAERRKTIRFGEVGPGTFRFQEVADDHIVGCVLFEVICHRLGTMEQFYS